jgi:hypothetical protein
MIFITASGSRYEIDGANHKFRRLNGKKTITSYLGEDGAWRQFAEMYPNPIKVGSHVLIIWSVEGDMPSTITSPVVEIDYQDHITESN